MKIKDKVLLKKDLEQGKFEQIIVRVNQLLAEDESSYLYYLRARAEYNLDEYNSSLHSIKKALSFKDADKELFLLAGRIYFHLHYYNKAKEFYLHALRIRPDYVEAMASFSFLLFIIGEDDKSKAMIDKANAIEKNNLFVQVANAKIALYSANKKNESILLEKIITHTTGIRYQKIREGFMCLFTGKKNLSRQLFREASKSDEQNQDLYKALYSLTSVPLQKKKKFVHKKTRNSMLFLLLNIIFLAVLFIAKLFAIFIAWCAVLALYALFTIIVTIVSMFKKNPPSKSV